MTVTEIQHKIKNGDKKTVMDATGCSESLLTQMLNGNRSIETPTGKKVTKAFQMIFENREKLKKQFQK